MNKLIDPENPLTWCQSDDDGYCVWEHCPQLRNGEPEKSGRDCPLDYPDESEDDT